MCIINECVFICRWASSGGGGATHAGEKHGGRWFNAEELEPIKLPGKLGTMTGNVLYPNDESKQWDVDRKLYVIGQSVSKYLSCQHSEVLHTSTSIDVTHTLGVVRGLAYQYQYRCDSYSRSGQRSCIPVPV